jgi:hypothetical protein
VEDTWKLEGPLARLVSKSSATGATASEQPSDQHPMNRSHSEMAKFEESDPYYKSIRSQLRDLESSAIRRASSS